MHEDVYQTMFEVEDRHWWYSAKRLIVLNLLRRYLRPGANGSKPKVADLGCGCGAMLAAMRETYDVVGVDDSPHAIEFCARRGIDVTNGALPDRLSLAPGTFDAVLLLDVLEHLERDAASVVAAAELLRPGAVMICTVPAYEWLWGPWDELHHHYRRYSKIAFAKLLRQPGLSVEMLSHCNTFLFPLAAGVRWIHRRPRSVAPPAPIRVPVEPINGAFRMIYGSERWLLGRVWLPFGLSLAAVVRKDIAAQGATPS